MSEPKVIELKDNIEKYRCNQTISKTGFGNQKSKLLNWTLRTSILKPMEQSLKLDYGSPCEIIVSEKNSYNKFKTVKQSLKLDFLLSWYSYGNLRNWTRMNTTK